MARKSRRNLVEEQVIFSLREYRFGSYARLSVRSNKIKNDDSISHQLQRNGEFISRNLSGSILTGEYCDNGVSGTTFNRPGFSELLKDIKSGKINAVIVKDFSRFGRNYLEALELLDVVFPELDVRFISIDEGYDSADPQCSKERMVYVIKHLANEYYARISSKKLTQAHELARGNGEFWGARPPYGFERSKANSKILVIDPEAASVVVRIFNMFVLEGYSYYKIAQILNRENIPSPKAYHLIKHGKAEKVEKNPEKYLWLGNFISSIIQNPVYIGCLVTHKTEQSYYKGKKLKRVPRQEWNIEEDALPRIIKQAIYDRAQKNAQKIWVNSFTREIDKKYGLFAGKLVCGVCGRHMSQSRYHTKQGIGIEYHCPGHDVAPNHCKNKFINEKAVLKAVTVLLDKWVSIAMKEKKAYKKDSFITKLKREYQNQIADIDREIQSLLVRQQQLYEDYVDQILDKREYIEFKRQNMEKVDELRALKGSLIIESNDMVRRYSLKNKWLSALMDKQGNLCVTAEIIDELISEIKIIDKTSMEVIFKFEDIFSMDLIAKAV